jgi:hypothetical protein
MAVNVTGNIGGYKDMPTDLKIRHQQSSPTTLQVIMYYRSLLEHSINSSSVTQPKSVLQYGYVPSEWASYIFLLLFGLSTCAYVPFV